ncbi:hypothetical protein UA75_25715 [Actinoalloteichus sp. GBA129-24]|nr:hypothetical protein UA75_25715 [Actinoalloteichus sp. GBA129-24]
MLPGVHTVPFLMPETGILRHPRRRNTVDDGACPVQVSGCTRPASQLRTAATRRPPLRTDSPRNLCGRPPPGRSHGRVVRARAERADRRRHGGTPGESVPADRSARRMGHPPSEPAPPSRRTAPVDRSR